MHSVIQPRRRRLKTPKSLCFTVSCACPISFLLHCRSGRVSPGNPREVRRNEHDRGDGPSTRPPCDLEWSEGQRHGGCDVDSCTLTDYAAT
jgi:hypothetical protein